ncbi:MAG: hypothetical protein EA412_03460 [Chitinophagaceae bacterium]|nr:MAG: hypothetical protein EA412_03460 [Chitinophagaceae bacterium]
MHELEPFYRWREAYIADEDERSPFFGRTYDEFSFQQTIYNYYIHPQWDEFGSPTLYLKILYVDYENAFAIIELIGEWNDCINNDIMFLKRNIIDLIQKEGINQFILLGENVLNFHASDDCYYEEWFEDLADEGGWIACLNFRDHVIDEMRSVNLNYYLNFGGQLNDINWRTLTPLKLYKLIDFLVLKALSG